MQWPSLHDAILSTIQLRWSDGTVMLEVFYFADGVRRSGLIKATGVMQLTCPRASAWGESDAINSVSLHEYETKTTMTIEMQSGDQISVEATTFDFQPLSQLS